MRYKLFVAGVVCGSVCGSVAGSAVWHYTHKPPATGVALTFPPRIAHPDPAIAAVQERFKDARKKGLALDKLPDAERKAAAAEGQRQDDIRTKAFAELEARMGKQEAFDWFFFHVSGK